MNSNYNINSLSSPFLGPSINLGWKTYLTVTHIHFPWASGNGSAFMEYIKKRLAMPKCIMFEHLKQNIKISIQNVFNNA